MQFVYEKAENKKKNIRLDNKRFYSFDVNMKWSRCLSLFHSIWLFYHVKIIFSDLNDIVVDICVSHKYTFMLKHCASQCVQFVCVWFFFYSLSLYLNITHADFVLLLCTKNLQHNNNNNNNTAKINERRIIFFFFSVRCVLEVDMWNIDEKLLNKYNDKMTKRQKVNENPYNNKNQSNHPQHRFTHIHTHMSHNMSKIEKEVEKKHANKKKENYKCIILCTVCIWYTRCRSHHIT